MLENPNFTSMTKAKIAEWAKKHLGIEITTDQTKDAMVMLAEAAIADRNAGAEQADLPGEGERAANTEQPPANIQEAFAPDLPPGDRSEPVPAAGQVRVRVNSHRTTKVPVSVNGRLRATLTVGVPALVDVDLLSVMNDSRINYTIL